MNKYTINEVDRLRIDCMYEKKKHYNARDRYSKYCKSMNAAIVILGALMGTSIYSSWAQSQDIGLKIICGILVVFEVVLVAVDKNLDFKGQSRQHGETADGYLYLMKEFRRIAERDSIDQDQENIEFLEKERAEIQKKALPTSEGDYKKAREGVEDGEETYTEQERQT